MNRVFVDTSAIFALLVPTDSAHDRAAKNFERIRARESVLLVTSYILVETYALLQRRFGRDATASFRSGFAPLLQVVWVDGDLHERGLDLMLERPSGVSLVDAISFLCIREHGVDEIFAFDHHFEQEGFQTLS